MGLEPTTFGTTIRRSNQLSYIHRVCPDLPSEQRANLIHFSIIAKFYPTFSSKIYAGLEIGDRFVPRYQRLHDAPGDDIGHRTKYECNGISGGFAFESHEYEVGLIGVGEEHAGSFLNEY